jgi:hypothetical protein
LIVTVTRSWFDDTAVEGILDIDGQFVVYTLEPTEYLIPEGTYNLVWYPSAEWKQYVPMVDGVPGRTNIEIHPGNWPRDSKGCTLVGEHRLTDVLGQSDIAFRDLKNKLQLPCLIVYRRNDASADGSK